MDATIAERVTLPIVPPLLPIRVFLATSAPITILVLCTERKSMGGRAFQNLGAGTSSTGDFV